MERDLIVYQFSRCKVEVGDLTDFLTRFAPESLPRDQRLAQLMDALVFCVEGYDEDEREIHSIPEVRAFYRKFHEAWPYWLYFCNLDQDVLRTMVLCCMESFVALKKDDQPDVMVEFDPPELLRFISRDFAPMNAMCERAGLSEEQIERRTRAVFEYFNLPCNAQPTSANAPTASSTMTVPEILKELEPYTGRFPMQAIRAAIAHREAITPELLRVVEAVAQDPVAFAAREGYMLHLFAMYLLAQFREQRAYRPLVKMFSAPGETPFDLAGDTVTEGLHNILASVYDGDPTPIEGLVEGENVNEYVRYAAIDTFIVLVESNQMSREEVVAYFRSLFQGKLKRTQSHVWNGLVCAVADLPAPELLEEVRQAYRNDLVDRSFARLEGIERDLSHPDRRRRERFAVITDVIAEMEWWAAFQPDDVKPSGQLSAAAPAPVPTSAVPAPRPQGVKVGRNDPCPCGSGKKYKKCCGKN